MSTPPDPNTPATPSAAPRATPAMMLTALVYAREFGWHVFPVWWIKENGDCACPSASRTRVNGACDRKGKHPITARGFVDATTDQAQIRTWWGKYPHANIGVATGASRLILLDADRHHAGCDGVEELHHLERQYGELPDGPIALTGGGGEHRLFRRPANLDAKLNSWPLAPGVDTRADLGYFVAPPSRHESGRTYQWDAAHDPTDTTVPECPAWIIQKLRTPKRKPIASGGSVMTGFLALAFKHAGWLERVIDDQRAVVQCPWESDHTTGRGSSTIVFAPSAGRSRGWFLCSHSHCATRTQDEVLARLPEAARTAAAREQVDSTREAAQARAGGSGESPAADAPPLSRDAVLELLRDRLRWTVRGSGDDQREVLVASLGNVATFLEYDPRLEHSIVYNEFAARRQLLQAPPWDPRSAVPRDWCDTDDVQGAEWLEREFGFVVGKQMVFDAACVVGQRHPIHPVRDYLNSLTWDRTPRLDGWLTEFCGADDTELIRAWASKWVISAVARIYQPGAKADHVLILEGKQGLRKSTALEALAGPDWFTDAADRLTDKDGVLNCSGKWIMELGELVALTRAEATHVKAFFSRRTDRIRRPYGRSAEDIPRQTVFCGTTNATEYLKDDTGNRRFWSVPVGKVDVEGIREHRDQLWAEAVHRFRAGEPWWLDRDDLIAAAEEVQDDRRHVDPWAEKLDSWLRGTALRSVTLNQVIEDGLGRKVTEFREAETQRAARAIMTLGWKKTRKRQGDRRWWAYEPAVEVE